MTSYSQNEKLRNELMEMTRNVNVGFMSIPMANHGSEKKVLQNVFLLDLIHIVPVIYT